MTEVKGKKTEKTYRAIRMDSYSSLKDFSIDRKKYYKKYFLNEEIQDEDEDSKASIVGRVVETLLLEPEEFDNRFYMSAVTEAPTGNMALFVEALYKHSKNNSDSEGNITVDFDQIINAAYVDSTYKWPLAKVLEKFIGTDNEIYYKEIRKIRSQGLTVVTADDISNGEKIVEELKSNFATSAIINLVNSDRYEIRNQFQVEGYKVDGHIFKSMFDKVIIDHKEKTIQVYDLKCTWNVENFYEGYYLYRRSYIQAYLYSKAAETLKKEFPEYEVRRPKFIVCDSINYFNPLVYTLSLDDMLSAYEGFEHKGRFYPGVEQIIKDLEWAIEKDVWNISRENYESGGEVKLRK